MFGSIGGLLDKAKNVSNNLVQNAQAMKESAVNTLSQGVEAVQEANDSYWKEVDDKAKLVCEICKKTAAGNRIQSQSILATGGWWSCSLCERGPLCNDCIDKDSKHTTFAKLWGEDEWLRIRKYPKNKYEMKKLLASTSSTEVKDNNPGTPTETIGKYNAACKHSRDPNCACQISLLTLEMALFKSRFSEQVINDTKKFISNELVLDRPKDDEPKDDWVNSSLSILENVKHLKYFLPYGDMLELGGQAVGVALDIRKEGAGSTFMHKIGELIGEDYKTIGPFLGIILAVNANNEKAQANVMKLIYDYKNSNMEEILSPFDIHYFSCAFEAYSKAGDDSIQGFKRLVLEILEKKKIQIPTVSQSIAVIPPPGAEVEMTSVPALVQLLRENISYSHWNYQLQSSLCEPRNTNEWRRWYLGQLVQREGYVILTCIGDNLTLPNMVSLPCFSLAANSEKKDVVLSIRGSSSQDDWMINLKFTVVEYTYRGTKGYAHKGFLDGANGILNNCGIADAIDILVNSGYSTIKVVGHSMGAAVSTLISAILNDRYATATGPKPVIQCFAYACPPCVDVNLASSLYSDGFVHTMINCNDLVPRLSKVNVGDFSNCIKLFKRMGLSKIWYEQDREVIMKKFPQYLSNMVSTGTINENGKNNADAVNDEALADNNVVVDVASDSPGKDDMTLLFVPGKILYVYYKGSVRTAKVGNYATLFDELTISKVTKEAAFDDHQIRSYQETLQYLHQHSQIDASTALARLKVSDAYYEALAKHDWFHPSMIDKWNDPLSIACGICGDSPAAHFQFPTNATVYASTKICTICSLPVCIVCAPAGEPAPAGMQVGRTTIYLPDNRILIPQLGGSDRYRVCKHCYMNACSI